MVKSKILLIVIFLIGCANELEYPLKEKIQFGSRESLDIVTWNLENFPKNDLQTVNEVIELIAIIDADIIALQEIKNISFFNEVLNNLDDYSGYLASSSRSFLNLAYIYKSDLNTDTPYEILNYNKEIFPRAPLVMSLQENGNLITIINNHLKCCNDGIERRKRAMDLLYMHVTENYNNQKIIILGDLNDALTDTTNNIFIQFLNDSTNFQFSDYEIALGSQSYWSYPSWPSHIDHILISNPLFLDVIETKTIKLEDKYNNGWIEYEKLISDHRPLGIRLVDK